MPSFQWGNGFGIGLFLGVALTLFFGVALSGGGNRVQAESDSGDHSQQEAEHYGQEYYLFSWWKHDGAFVSSKDTLAQWAMAFLGLIATGLSGWAVILLKKTLKETETASRAALDGVAVTREIGVAQTRAYLGLANGYMDADGIHMTFRNFGSTPAMEVSITSTFRYKDHGADGGELIERPQDDGQRLYWKSRTPGIIDPGAEFYAHMKVLEDDYIKIKSSQRWGEICLEIQYTTQGSTLRRFGDYGIRADLPDRNGNARLIALSRKGRTGEVTE